MTVAITLPYPPSVNHYWRTFQGRMILSKAGREYRHAAAVVALSQRTERFAATDRLSLLLHVCPPDRRRRDLDNVLKAVLDALQHAGVYPDDSQIDDLRVTRLRPVSGGEVRVVVGWLAMEAEHASGGDSETTADARELGVDRRARPDDARELRGGRAGQREVKPVGKGETQ